MSAYNTKNHPLLFYQNNKKRNKKGVCVCAFEFQFLSVLWVLFKKNSFKKDPQNLNTNTHTLKDIQRNDQSYPKREYNV